VLEEFGSTIPVHPGFSAAVDRHGNVLISRDTMAGPHREAW
jgi:N-methylhydantoinase A